ncbi:YebW family protein [Sodalis sp. RH21]|uniref:YebW family protein n=1 Tax=unclassified Sodalis (in: enterobacteria) TaxID=2636512 RepID=UPI0039B58669
MYALVVFICYLGQDCEDLLIGAYSNETQCLSAMTEQRLRYGGCYPIEQFIDGFWLPAHEYADF